MLVSPMSTSNLTFCLLESNNEKVGLPKTDHVKPLRESEDSLGGFFDLSPRRFTFEFQRMSYLLVAGN